MRKSANPNFGRNVFPSPTADPRGRQIGQTPFRRCQQCGLPYDTRRTAWAPQGDGLGDPTTVSSSTNTKDRANIAGCRFCGTLQVNRVKPEPLPDDRNFPSDEWRNYKRRRR